MGDGSGDRLQHVFWLDLQLVLDVQWARGDDDVDTPTPGVTDGLGAAIDIHQVGAAKAGDRALRHYLGDLADGFEVAVGGDREAGLDHIDAHLFQDLGELDLFLERHRGARRLLAVAHGGVEDDDPVALGARSGGFICGGGHGLVSSRRFRWGQAAEKTPERPAAKTRSLERRPGAAKPQRKKKQAGGARAHGDRLYPIGPNSATTLRSMRR